MNNRVHKNGGLVYTEHVMNHIFVTVLWLALAAAFIEICG